MTEFYDLTSSTNQQEENNIPILTPRDTAILKHVWRLTREEKNLCTAFFINKVRVSRFLELITEDRVFNERLKVNNYDLITNYMYGNRALFERQYKTEEFDFWILVSCRVNYLSRFYECLIRRSWELNETEEGYVEL